MSDTSATSETITVTVGDHEVVYNGKVYAPGDTFEFDTTSADTQFLLNDGHITAVETVGDEIVGDAANLANDTTADQLAGQAVVDDEAKLAADQAAQVEADAQLAADQADAATKTPDVALAADAADYAPGSIVTVEVKVGAPEGNANVPSGSVSLTDGTTTAPVELDATGAGSVEFTALDASYSIDASYSGDSNFVAAEGSLSVTVTPVAAAS